MLRKTKQLFLLAIIVASTIVSSFSFADTAFAAPANLYLAPAVKKDAQASAYRVGLALCTELGDLESSLGENTSAGNISSGKWFAQERAEPQVRVGYLVDPDNGQVQCRNFFSGHDVAKTLGWNSNIELACGIGYTRTNGSNCVDGTGDFTKNSTSKNEIYNKIDAKYKNASGGNGFNAIQTYVMAANTLVTTCGWKPVINLDAATADQKNADDLYEVKVVTGTGKVTTVLYRKNDNGGKAFKNDENSFDYVNQNCEWMKDRMKDHATAYANWVKDHKADNGDEAGTGTENEEEEEGGTSCVINGIGWILCPVMNFLAAIVDAAYGFVASLLTIQPLFINGESAGVYNAWSTMRNFANVAFVIAFLIIIFSQISSIGITNYGIKKMLPRLIIAAVLVNVSYWICSIAVDLSNIIGGSLNDVLKGIGENDIVAGPNADDFGATADGWAGITGGILAGVIGAAILYAAIGALLPALVTAALAIVVVFVVLAARQALVILLVVISPLAFVAYLLPNTENLYKKWFNLFKTMLLMFPIIALLFGASSLASKVIMNSASGPYELIIQLMGATISIVPLVATPFLMKTAGGVLGKVGGFINNPNKGPFDKARKRAEAMGNRIEGRRQMSALNGSKIPGRGKYRREAERNAINAGVAREAQRSQGSYLADKALNDTRFQNSLAGGVNAPNVPGWVPKSDAINSQLDRMAVTANNAATNRAVASATQVRQAEDTEAIKNTQTQLTATIRPGDTEEMTRRLQQAITSEDSVTARALQNMMLTSGSPGINAYRNAVQNVDGGNTASGAPVATSAVMTEMKRNLLSNHGGVKASAADLTRHASDDENRTMREVGQDAGTWKLPDAELVKQKTSSIRLAGQSGAITQEQAVRINNNPELNQHLDQAMRESIDKLANGMAHAQAFPPTPPNPTPPTP